MTSKNKKIVLIFVIFLLIILCYQMAISNTLNLKKEYNTLTKEQLVFKETPKQLSILSKKEIVYDSILKEMNLENGSIENNLLKILNRESKKNKLKVIDFNSPHISSLNGVELNTFLFTLEGNFSNILNVIYILEQKVSFGEIVHLKFEKKKNYRTSKNYLQAEILLQLIK